MHPTISARAGWDLRVSSNVKPPITMHLMQTYTWSGSWMVGTLTHAVYHADGNGYVTYLVNSSQSKVAEYWYDPFGNTISSSGSLATANVYRFSSKEVNADSGLYYYGYRFYDRNLQRWPNRDPLGEPGFEMTPRENADVVREVPNLYGFVHNDSLNRLDPLGLSDSKSSNPIFDLLKSLKKIYDNMPDNPKKCMDPCSAATSLRTYCDCFWNALQKTKSNPQRGIADLVQCFCQASTDPGCDAKWRKRVEDLFKPATK